MNLGEWARTHRRSLLFLVALIAFAGVFSGMRLPATLFPAVDFPRVLVSIEAGDQPAEQMEVQITRIVEQAIRQVPGVRNVRSTTSRGSAEVSVNFDWGLDMASETLQVSSALSQILPQLPSSTQLNVRR